MSLLTLEHVSKAYDRLRVLDDVSFEVEAGSITGLLGPNGCGKTTTMKILTGLIGTYDGAVAVEGMAPGLETKKIVSYLPEKTYLSGWMRCIDTIDMFADFYADFDRSKALELLDRLRLSPRQKIKLMSKGMQEKLQLILVMSRAAKLYVLDEPLSGVDPAARSLILDIILKNYNPDASILLSTHLIYDVERIFDHIILLGYGKVVLSGSVDDIRSSTGKSIDEVFREVFKC